MTKDLDDKNLNKPNSLKSPTTKCPNNKNEGKTNLANQ